MEILNLVRNILWAVAACLGGVVCARLLFGLYTVAGIAVNAPLNPEGVFGLLIVVLLLLPLRVPLVRKFEIGPSTTKPSPWPLIALVVGLPVGAFIALSRALQVYFVSDDFIIVRLAQRFSSAVFTSPGGDGFFRPLGYVSLAMNAWFAGVDPGWWHASALVLHAVNALLVALLTRRLAGGWVTPLLTGTLFALHGTHLEAAVWIAGRFDLLAAMFTLATLLLFERNTALALLCALAALWSKESAYVLPFLVAILARMEGRPWKRVAPFAGITAVAFVYRWALLGGIGGYRESTGDAAFYSLKFTTTAKAVFVRLWTSLFFPINWSEDPSWIVGLLGVLYVATLLWLAWRGGTSGVRWMLLALGASILPPLHLLGGSADLSGGRLLYLPSIWFCMLLVAAPAGLPKRKYLAASAILVVFHFAAVQHDLGFWIRTSEQVREICASPTPPANPPTMIGGVPALANGLTECMELAKRLQ